MALKTLPAKWCVLRTTANNGRINQYFNNLRNYAGWYEGEEERYFTNNTEKGNKTGPFKSKPDSYTLITYSDFCNLVLDEPLPETGGKTRLPNFWAVLSDNSNHFRATVITYLNTLRKPGAKSLTGETKFYYGFDGDAKSCFEITEFSKKVELLTLEEFIALHAIKTGKIPEGASIASKPSKTAPVAAREQEVVDFKLIKKYPGMEKLGHLASAILPSFNGPKEPRCIGEFANYWEPVLVDIFVVDDYVKLKIPIGTTHPAGSILKVISVSGDNYSKLLNVKDSKMAQPTSIRIMNVTTPTPEEIKQASAILINGRPLMLTPENTVQFGAAILTKAQVDGLREFMYAEGAAKIVIGNQNISSEMVIAAMELF